MKHRVIVPGAIALVALLGSGSTLEAQQWRFGAGLVGLAWNQAGLPVAGCVPGMPVVTSPGVSANATRRLGASPLAVELTARAYPWRSAPQQAGCMLAPPAPGTRVTLLGSIPLERRFATTDARIEFSPHLGDFAPALALGAGSLWSWGAPVPYGLVAGSLGIEEGRVGMTILGEYDRLGLSFDRMQQVYATDPSSGYVVLASQTDLGNTRVWKSVKLLAVRFDFAVRTPR